MTVANNTGVALGSDPEYDAFLARVNKRFNERVAEGFPLLTTDATGLWEAYLGGFSEDFRQHNNCHACRQFIERFGGLVQTEPTGKTHSAIWDAEDAPEAYKASVTAMIKIVHRAKVTGVFLSSEKTWGTPATGPWHHFSVTPPAALVMRKGVQTAGQAMAEKREDFGQVMRALTEFTAPLVEQALRILRADALYRSEKVLGQAEWLNRLHEQIKALKGVRRTNMIWHEVAKAPAGFCHPRASMIGTLLEDLAAGMDFEAVSKRFAAKMHPLAYQRPQAAPTQGAIDQAEKLVKQMGIERSLLRRYCRTNEVIALWRPSEEKVPDRGAGVFGHLKPKGATPIPDVKLPMQTMTLAKFRGTVLPTAEGIEVFIGYGNLNFSVLLTAVDPEAPPILQWDSEDLRNSVSQYVWTGGSTAGQFGISAGAYCKVNALAFMPHQWHDENAYKHHGKGLLFLLHGAIETRQSGMALFPETLRSEMHGVRSVIEAHSKSGHPEGFGEPHAVGLRFDASLPTWDCRVRVTSCGHQSEYKIDRWD